MAAQRSSISARAVVKWVRRSVDVRGVDGGWEGAAAADAAGQGLFHRRRHQRVKRRFACEFLAAGQRYRGIVVELSKRGLFVQTDATTSPGSEIELHLAGAGAVPELRLRGVVVRRRMVPAPLATAVRRGIAVEILEAPREYGLACGSDLLDAPIRLAHPGRDDSGDPVPEEAPAFAGPLPWREPEAPRQEAAVREPAPVRPAPASDLPARPEALLVDDGSLGDVEALLRELAVDTLRVHVFQGPCAEPFVQPTRLFITTARLACSLHLPAPDGEDGPVGVAVAEDESQTLSTLMRRLGFHYLVHRPTHPEALRLLLQRILYRGVEQRRAARMPFGAEVRWRSGWRRRRGPMLEISATGCRLLAADGARAGTRVRISIPAEATGDRRIVLRGCIARREARPSADASARFALAVTFDPPSSRMERRLDALLARSARGPATLPRPGSEPGSATAKPARSAEATATPPPRVPEASDSLPAAEPAGPPADPIPAGPPDRRRTPRVRLDREVVALDEAGTRVLHALVGRDLSPV